MQDDPKKVGRVEEQPIDPGARRLNEDDEPEVEGHGYRDAEGYRGYRDPGGYREESE